MIPPVSLECPPHRPMNPACAPVTDDSTNAAANTIFQRIAHPPETLIGSTAASGEGTIVASGLDRRFRRPVRCGAKSRWQDRNVVQSEAVPEAEGPGAAASPLTRAGTDHR